eukprot:TRINITY_DN3424_c0_g1_i1.p1 TRINITY_DN3424_c0_g1~~TRINITY_DN3424_c0_g1_i1.p1  ORF type:complete len:143 (+),score=17.58 TRINITY_DN3424_c0_g1_i1:105-533(+)
MKRALQERIISQKNMRVSCVVSVQCCSSHERQRVCCSFNGTSRSFSLKARLVLSHFVEQSLISCYELILFSYVLFVLVFRLLVLVLPSFPPPRRKSTIAELSPGAMKELLECLVLVLGVGLEIGLSLGMLMFLVLALVGLGV